MKQACIFALFLLSVNTFAWVGSGTKEDPFQISDSAMLIEMSAQTNAQKYLNSCFILTADISLDSRPFAPIGAATLNINDISGKPTPGAFNGTFDGNSHTIANLALQADTRNFTGFFAMTDFSATVKNLKLENVTVLSRYGSNAQESQVGLLSGLNNGIIENCSVTASKFSGSQRIGGLVSKNQGTIRHSFSSVNLIGSVACGGGLAGYATSSSIIENCYSTGSVDTSRVGTNSVIGGLIGFNEGIISNCYSTGNVNGGDQVGGLVGYNSGNILSSYASGDVISTDGSTGGLVGGNLGLIENAYAVGNVSSTGKTGGLVGYNASCISNSFSTGKVLGTSYLGGFCGENNGLIENSFSSGEVRGMSYVGGFTGTNMAGGGGIVKNSYSTGRVRAESSNHGGFLGDWNSFSVYNCYFDDNNEAIDDKLATRLTSGDMTNNIEFVKKLGLSIWHLDSVVRFNDGYPVLYWQGGRKVSSVTAKSTPAGLISADSIFAEGDWVSLTASAVEKQVFKKWITQGMKTNNPANPILSFVMPANDVVATALYADTPDTPVTQHASVTKGVAVNVTPDNFNLIALSQKFKLDAFFSEPFPKPGKIAKNKKIAAKMVSDIQFVILGSVRLIDEKIYKSKLKTPQTTREILLADSGVWTVQKDSVIASVRVKITPKSFSDSMTIAFRPPTIDSVLILWVDSGSKKETSYAVTAVKVAGTSIKGWVESLENNKVKKSGTALVKEAVWISNPELANAASTLLEKYPYSEVRVFKLSKNFNTLEKADLVIDNKNGLGAFKLK